MMLILQLPPVPQLVMPASAQLVVTAIVSVIAVAAVIGAVVIGRRHRTPLYLLVLLGGSVSSINEPIADVLGGIMHPQQGGWTVFSTFDRPMPAWVVIAYGLFFGLVPLIVLAIMRGGNPRKRLLSAVGVIFAANLIIELPVLASGMYVYYGNQPFFVLGLFPLFWLFVNATGVATIAVALYRHGHRLRGVQAVWALILPAAAQASALSVGVPAFSLYNTDSPTIWKWVAATVTMLLGAAALRGLSRLVPDQTPTPAQATAAPESLGAVSA